MELQTRYTINIAKDFSPYPAGRYRSEGPFSGQAFLEDHLKPKLSKAMQEHVVLEVDLTGIEGFPSSFVSGSFGKLAYELGKSIGSNAANATLLKHLRFICKDSNTKIEAFESEIRQSAAASESDAPEAVQTEVEGSILKQVPLLRITQQLFPKSTPLGEFETTVLERTMLRLSKSTPTLPGRK